MRRCGARDFRSGPGVLSGAFLRAFLRRDASLAAPIVTTGDSKNPLLAAAKTVGEQSSEAEEETGIEAQIFLGVSLALGLLFALTKHQASDEQREDEGMAPGPAAEL